MSVVLTVYSQNAYKEFVLPSIHNAEMNLHIPAKMFHLGKDLELHLERMDDQWYLCASLEYRYESNGENREAAALHQNVHIRMQVRGNKILFLSVQEKETAFVSYDKYDISKIHELIIGSGENASIYYTYGEDGAEYISRKHAVIRMKNGEAFLEDCSKNGTFVNDIRINGEQRLCFGDNIHMWGLDMVYLGTILAVRSDSRIKIKNETLLKWRQPYTTAGGEKGDRRAEDEYHRSPRELTELEKGKIEIEAPPAPRELEDTPLMMTVGPALTMAIPMVMSSALAIVGARSSGVYSNTFMYTGIITSVASAVIGAGWAINNLRYTKGKAKKEENRRFEAYSEYLIRCTEEIKQKYEYNRNCLLTMYPSAGEWAEEALHESSHLWGKNQTHEDFLACRLGIGDIPFQVEIQIPREKFTLINDSLADKPAQIQESYRILHKVPVCIDLLQEKLVGIVGGKLQEGAYPVVYTLVTQLATQNCYTDVKMGFIFSEEQGEDEHRWEFAKWLSHTWSQDKKSRLVAGNKNEASEVFYEVVKELRIRNENRKTVSSEKSAIYKPHYVLFIEDVSFLEGEPIAKYIFDEEQNLGLTVILMAEEYEKLPNACECVIQNDGRFTGLYDVRSGKKETVELDRIEESTLEKVSRKLSNLRVNEIESGGDIPASINFFDMYGVTQLSEFHVEERWKKNRTYENMRALVGLKAGGAPCYLDIHEKYHGPHGLVAGTTGSGKSETLQTYMLSLALNFSPDDIGFFIIDYKGGGMANLFNGLPHILGQISNLSGNQVHRAMVSIKSENKRRQRVFNEHGVNNINAYTTLYKNGEAETPVPHLFIIIDEFAELKREEGDFMKELISVAQVGRSLGVHLILATQKPGGTVDENIWSNSKFRLCLRVQDRQDSTEMLHRPDAAYLTQAGRCYLQVGNDEVFELFQSGWSGAVYDENIENTKKTLAVMLENTGKAALTGNHTKRQFKEAAKRKWMMRLCRYMESCQGKSDGDHLDKTERLEYLHKHMYQCMREDKVEYAENDYNNRALENFYVLMEEAVRNGCEELEEISAWILKKAEERELKLPEQKEKTQLDALVQYLAGVSQKEHYRKPQQLWLPVLPERLTFSELEGYEKGYSEQNGWKRYPERWELKTQIGLVDAPMQQAQMPLELNFTEMGHHAVCGMAMSGKSTFLQSVIYSLICRYSPEYLNVYILDFSSRMLSVFEEAPHVGGILYESDIDAIGKMFHLIEGMIQERKQLFKGGNYSQYVMTHGLTCPAVLFVIDNVAGFREKTEFFYDDMLIQLSRECAAYGIYLLLSGSGFSNSEIPTRMRDNVHYVVSLEMQDRFQYGDALNCMQLAVIPDPGIHGRGLAMVGGEALEFQTALPVIAEDDYKRNEWLQKEADKFAKKWTGKPARKIPRLPEKAVWSEFEQLDGTQTAIQDDRSLPVGYEMETADVYSVDLARVYCYMISGKGRTGKTNLLKIMAMSAQKKGGRLAVVELGGQELMRFSENIGARYVDSYAAYKEYMFEFVPEFQRRNKIRKECLTQGMEEDEIYSCMAQEENYYFFISDLASFVTALHDPSVAQDNLWGGMANLFEKGFMHGFWFFACFDQDRRVELIGKEVYESFVRSCRGIHMGGNVAAQRLFEFNGMPYSEQAAVEKAGIGAVPPSDNERWHKVLVPLAKG